MFLISDFSQNRKIAKLKAPPKFPVIRYVPIPLALAESSGIPINGQKSNTTKSLKTRYKDATPQVFLKTIPDGWVAKGVMVKGMFILNTTPLEP